MAGQMVSLRARLLQLCLYPAILAVMMFAFLGIALFYLIPQMKSLFNDMNIPVPRLMLLLEGLPLMILMAGIIFLILFLVFKTKLKKIFQTKIIKFSFVYILFFLPFLSAWVSFLKAGLNEEEAMTGALALLPEILRADFYGLSLGLKAGYPLGKLIDQLPHVPLMIKSLIQSSAQSENLLQVLDFLQIYLEDSQNKTVQLFFTWAEPVLMILMGSVVAGFLVMIFMPFLNLSQNYGVAI
jgi:type II secretory pathway component PulF